MREAFVREFMVDRDATQAAIRAGFSAKSAKQTGWRLLREPAVRAAIDAETEARAERVGLTADQVLAELKVIGLSSVDDYEVGPDGRLRVRAGRPPEAIRAVSSYRLKRLATEGGGEAELLDLKLHNKLEALKLAALHLKLFGEGDGSAALIQQKVFLLPVMPASAEEWQRLTQARRALPPGKELSEPETQGTVEDGQSWTPEGG
jgi:phage terminase small subunit